MVERSKLYALIAEKLDVEDEEIRPGRTFEDLGADSVDVVQLMMAIEEEFGITIPDDDLNNLKTVGDLEKFFQRTHALT